MAAAVERAVTRRSRRADRATVARMERRLRAPDTRAEVHEFHAQRRMFDVPYDPDTDAVRGRPAPEGGLPQVPRPNPAPFRVRGFEHTAPP